MSQRELVLNFHGIGTPHRGVSTDEQPVWVSRHDFVTWLDQIPRLSASYSMPIEITFDDGNASDLAVALPELRQRNLNASFFVCAGRLGMPEYLDRAGLRCLLDAGMQIGSHGMHHRDWQTLSDEALTEEISTARKMLEDACGRTVNAAAVPFGSYNRRVLARLKAEGFSHVYTSDRGLARKQAWLKPRNTLRANSTRDDLLRVLNGRNGPEAAFRAARQLYKRLR